MESQISAFSFQSFQINRSEFSFPEIIDDNIGIDIVPSGIYQKKTNRFHLKLDVKIKKEEKPFINVIGTAIFQLENIEIEDDKKDDYFCLNAPAIFFPYIRAYISTLTIQSGLKPIILPTLNLTKLKEILKDAISIKG